MTAAAEQVSAERATEMATLGACLLLGESRTASGLLARGLRPEHFYWQTHRDVFTAIAALADRGSGVDHMTVMSELDRLGLRRDISQGFVEELLGHVPAAGNSGAYADRVIELSLWRDRQRALQDLDLAVASRDATRWAQARASLDAAVAGTRTESYSPERWGALLFDHFAGGPENDNAISLPFPRLTRALGGGLWPGEVMVLSGPTSHGKSIFADMVLDHAASAGRKCHLYMTEMTAITRGLRYLARRTGVQFLKQRSRDLSESDRQKILAELPRIGYGCTVAADWSVDDIVRDALRARYDIVVVDLLHGFHYEDERGLDRLSKAMQRLARVSTTLDGHPGTAVVAVTHLKEEGIVRGKIPRPTLASIKGGSSIKQDADFVVFVWQENTEGVTTGDGEIWVPKGRSGDLELQQVTLQTSRFRFIARSPQSQLADAEPATTSAPF